MQLKSIITTFILAGCLLTACNNNKAKDTTDKSTSAVPEKSNSDAFSSSANSETPANDLIDTTKLKSDLNDILNSVVSGKPDTTKLKKASGDIMTTDANVLSDSGIDKLYGNSNDPSVKAAADALKKMRNGMGITPGKLDSIRKEASALQH